MPFVKGSVSERIEQKRKESAEFRRAWDESRKCYDQMGNIVRKCHMDPNNKSIDALRGEIMKKSMYKHFRGLQNRLLFLIYRILYHVF